MDELAKRAVACKGWRWLPGMLAIHPKWRGFRASHVGLTGMHGVCRFPSPMGGVERAVVALPLPTSSDVLPDLSDDLTRLGLLALVRRVRPYACVEYCGGYWRVVDPADEHWDTDRGFGPWCSEAEALVAALEAAP